MILNANAISPRFKSRVQQLNLIFEDDIFSELYNGPTKPNKWNKMYSKYFMSLFEKFISSSNVLKKKCQICQPFSRQMTDNDGWYY